MESSKTLWLPQVGNMLAMEGDTPVVYVCHCALEEDGQFELSF